MKTKSKMETKDRVIKTFSEIFNVDAQQIKLTDTMEDIESWDSIGHLQLIMSIEAVFGIKLNMEEVVQINSVEKCVDVVSKHL
jgi:acyl carrier protein